jgi:SpoVK/Ycf46/Vps4 family AAA+-type ATPase
MLGSREPLARTSFDGFTTDIGRPTVVEQRAVWAASLSSAGVDSQDSIAARLACQYGLNAPEIRRIVLETPAEPAETLGDRLWEACRNRSRPRLDTLAQRIDPKATWDDLVVTDETYYLLREIVSQSRTRDTVYEDWGFAKRMNRGLGISALFAGESGTGKTMAAEVIANELHLSLYRIDLSQVVSKYIGETEKNLQRVFDLMEGGGSILFFDEADALFGKRSEVRDSHDRYANIEINYLLQRMESYTGLAILATNMKSALDKAFIRRLRFIVTFEFPGPAERKAMWQKAFPEEVPRAELDYDRLARLHCTGASIHSIALSAAFRAAKAKGPVDMETVMMAARTEFRKMERPLSEADLLVKK